MESALEKKMPVKSKPTNDRQRFVISMAMIAFGIIAGLVSLVLLSNQFGNTDRLGLVLFGCAGWVLVTGVCHLFLRFPYAAMVGAMIAPFLVALLFVLFWVALFATSFQSRYHQEFAANGVSQIQPSKQMDELYDDCRHYITYGENKVPLFNSVAYFGNRYELSMQVPVKILSGRSGAVIGEPKFYLYEVSSVSVSPSGQIGVSYSSNLDFGPDDWKRVYENNGDFSKIGFNINSTGVPDFQKYTDASRPSN